MTIFEPFLAPRVRFFVLGSCPMSLLRAWNRLICKTGQKGLPWPRPRAWGAIYRHFTLKTSVARDITKFRRFFQLMEVFFLQLQPHRNLKKF